MTGLCRKALLALGAAIALSCATLACSALLGLEPPPSGPDGSDGGCMVRYVSTSGNDGNTGCEQDKPMKTIGRAIGAFENAGLTGYAVEVCAGQYPETDLRMQSRGSLLGGYNCDTWTRTGTYDKDLVNESTITVGAPDSNHEVALTIGAATVDAGVSDADVPDGGTASLLVDGFSIVGPSNTPESYAVRVNQSATGTLSNCRIFGGDATNTSAGVYVLTAAPQIANNLIQSGRALTAVGVDVATTGASPWIRGNIILSKDATAGSVLPNGSFGIRVLPVNGATSPNIDANRIEDNTVQAGNGPVSAGIKLFSVNKGIVRRNRAQSLPTGTKNAGLGSMRGISIETSNNVQVLANRVYGGGSSGGVGPLYGIFVLGGQDDVIANNMVYGGYYKLNGAGMGNALGIALIGTTHPTVVFNTIFSGFAPTGGNRAYDISVAASTDGVATTGAVIENNIFAGSGVNDFGIYLENCATGIDSLDNNVFFAQQTGLAYLNCDGGGPNRNVQDMNGLSRTGAKSLDGNVTLRSAETCGKTDDAGICVVRPECPFYGILSNNPDGGQVIDGGSACVASVFGAWSSSDDGNSTLLTGGLVLGDAAPCAVSAGGRALTPAFTTDIFNKARPDVAPSMGAAEDNATCP